MAFKAHSFCLIRHNCLSRPLNSYNENQRLILEVAWKVGFFPLSHGKMSTRIRVTIDNSTPAKPSWPLVCLSMSVQTNYELGCYLQRGGQCVETEQSQSAGPYLFVVLLEVSQLLTQGFILNLQVSPAQGYLIQNSSQPVDVSFYALVESQLIFVPLKVAVIFPVCYMVGESPIVDILQTQDF